MFLHRFTASFVIEMLIPAVLDCCVVSNQVDQSQHMCMERGQKLHSTRTLVCAVAAVASVLWL